MNRGLVCYITVLNITGFMMFGIDKYKAVHRAWRIPEKSLMLCAGLGGGIGCLAGMYVFHHKTRHKKFTIGIPLLTLVWIGILVYCGG